MNESSVPEFESEPADYPTSWEFDGLLADGGAALIRPVRPGDETSLAALHLPQLPGTTRAPVSSTHPALIASELSQFTVVDYHERMAFVAVAADEIVAFAAYAHLGAPESAAQVVFVVDDAYQHRGVATLLFESLVAYAYAKGIDRFTAEVLAQNTKMLNVLASSGLNATSVSDGEVISIEIDLHPTAKYRASATNEIPWPKPPA